nr:MAG TPA: hypothetical protein [Caudoviricetes sp.]
MRYANNFDMAKKMLKKLSHEEISLLLVAI